jgi:hypothetical protein
MRANIQNQGVRALCKQGRHWRWRALRGCTDARRGLIAADLGGGVIKRRIARRGQGKSGGFRTLIVFRSGIRAVFVHGFAKNEKDNIEKDELAALKKLAAELLAYDDKATARAIASGALAEVTCDEKTIP